MLGSGVLDTAIGLIFVFLLVSLLVTTVNEMISAALLSRAKWLRIGVDRLLGSAWAQKLYAHPLIEGSPAKPKAVTMTSLRGSGPSYIASRSFANVLLDLIREGDETLANARRALQDALDATSGAGASVDDLKAAIASVAATVRPAEGKGSALPLHLSALLNAFPSSKADVGPWLDQLGDTAARIPGTDLSATQQALKDLVVACRQTPTSPDAIRARLQTIIDAMPYATMAEQVKGDLAAQLKRLQAGYTVGDARAVLQKFIDGMPARYLREVVERVPDERIRKTMLVLLDDAEGDVERFKQNVEIWFNNAMDRVGGWYKRRSQLVIGIVAVITAVGLNVDALLIVRHLETHPGVRDALVAQAKGYADSKAAPAPVVAGTTVDTSTTGTAVPEVDLPAKFQSIETQLSQLGLPIGWVRSQPTSVDIANRMAFPGAMGLGDTIAFHLVGWLITALAAMLGAPFWFDMLNKVISIRSAGKSPEEMPKSPKSVPAPLEPGQSPAEADAIAALGKR